MPENEYIHREQAPIRRQTIIWIFLYHQRGYNIMKIEIPPKNECIDQANIENRGLFLQSDHQCGLVVDEFIMFYLVYILSMSVNCLYPEHTIQMCAPYNTRNSMTRIMVRVTKHRVINIEIWAFVEGYDFIFILLCLHSFDNQYTGSVWSLNE